MQNIKKFSYITLLASGLITAGCKAASFKSAGNNRSGPAGGESSSQGDSVGSGSGPAEGNGDGSTNASGTGGTSEPTPTAPVIKANGSTTDITVAPGTAVTITWSAPGATECVVQPLNATGTTGTSQVQATATQAYTLSCQNPGGPSTTSVNVIVVPPLAPTVAIKANGQTGTITASPGELIQIAWQSQNADQCSVAPSGGSGLNGTTSATMAATPLVYTVTCTSTGGTTMASVTVNPTAAQPSLTAQLLVNGTAVPVYVPYESTVSLTWTSTGATSCNLAPLNDTRLSGSIAATDKLTASMLYVLTCKSSTSSVVSALAVNVGLPAAPTPDLKVNGSDGPVVIAPGSPVSVKWTTTNLTTACTMKQNSDAPTSVALSGEITTTAAVLPVTYTLTCNGPGGQGVDSVAIMPVVTLPTVTITANGQSSVVTVAPGSMVDVVWTSQGASSCALSPGSATGLSGKQVVGPIQAVQTVGVICNGPFGSSSANVTIVPSLPNLSATLVVNGSTGPITVPSGLLLNIAWASVEAQSCTLSPFNWTGTAGIKASPAVSANLTVTLTCVDGRGHTATASVPVTVTPHNVWSSVSLQANGSTDILYILNNAPPVQLVWHSSNTVGCAFSDGVTVASNGAKLAHVTSDTKFTITCRTVSGSHVTSSVWVKVRNSCVYSTKVGINFEDTPPGIRDGDFNDFVACADKGQFATYGTEVISERAQTVPFTTSKISACSHRIRVEIHHPDGSEEPPLEFDDGQVRPTLMLKFKKGSRLEVKMTPIAGCAIANVTHSMHDPVWAIVKPDECRRTGI